MGQILSHGFIPARRLLAQAPAVEVAGGARLLLGRVHEVCGPGADLFALLAAGRAKGRDVVWIGLGRDVRPLAATGLEAYLEVDRLLLVEAVSRAELLWAGDAALRAAGGFIVIVDLPTALSLKESRRLQLAAEQGGGLGLLLLRGPAGNSAAQTRWQCEPAPGAASREGEKARAAAVWTCEKGRSGEAGRWQIEGKEVQRGQDPLHLAARASA